MKINCRLTFTAVALMAASAMGISAVGQEKENAEKLTPVKTIFVEGTHAEGEEGAAMVADGHKWTKWCLDAPKEMPYKITLDAGKSIALKAYALTTAEDTHSYPMRNPIAWNIYGSNDCKEWKTVEQIKYSRKLSDENEQTYFFKIQPQKQWRYYRFEFTRMTEGTRIQLAEIELYE